MNFRGKVTWVTISFVALVVVAVALLAVWRARLHQQADARAAGFITIYTCPMHPAVVAGELGKCPICGMDLIPMERPKEKAPPAAALPSAAPGDAPQAAPPATSQE